MARLGWTLRTTFLPWQHSAPRLSGQFPETRRMQWRYFCTPKGSSKELSLPKPLEHITIVDSTKSAVRVVQTLLELPLNRRVSWNTQLYKPPVSASASAERVLSASAYAGDDVDFGNGPHLFVSAGGSPEDEAIWNLLRRYFQIAECQKVWFDYSSSMRALALKEVRPAGFGGDVVHMARLYRDRQRRTDIDTIAKAFLTKSMLAKSLGLWERNGLPNDQVTVRKWEAKLNETGIDTQWIVKACYDAFFTHELEERLRKLLKQTSVHGDAYSMPNGSSAMHRNEDIFNLLQAYESFFHPFLEASYAVEVQGLPVDIALLQHKANEEKHTKRFLEDDFRRWASTFSSDALYMDLGSAVQLRQLLFAPCENVHNKKDSLQAEQSFKLKKSKRDELARTESSRKDGEIRLKGAGIKSISHTKQGWPSTSAPALRGALDEYRSNPPGKVLPGFPQAMECLLQSIEIGRRLKWYANLKNVGSIADKDGRIRMRYQADFYTGHLVNSSQGKHWEPIMMKSISPQEGNDLVHIEYAELGMWTLALLSGCSSLRGRLNSERRSDMLLAYELFLRSQTDERRASLSAVSSKQCDAASMLDEAIRKGGEADVVKSLVGCTKEEAARMVKTWYDLHPGVLKWRKERAAFIVEHGYAETYVGRRRKVRKTRVGEGVGFIVNGTAAEIVMGGVISLHREERISALGWKTVHVDRDAIVLEGPTWSTDSLMELLKSVLRRPTGFEMNTPPPVKLTRIEGEKMEMEGGQMLRTAPTD